MLPRHADPAKLAVASLSGPGSISSSGCLLRLHVQAPPSLEAVVGRTGMELICRHLAPCLLQAAVILSGFVQDLEDAELELWQPQYL